MAEKTTRDMSDRHEDFLAETFGGRRTPGSGNQFHRQMDVRDAPDVPYALAWDGKSTHAASVSVTKAMWDKARLQAAGEIPALALRWYADARLTVVRDLVVLDAHDFAEILEAARMYRRTRVCLENGHVTSGDREHPNNCVACGLAVGHEE